MLNRTLLVSLASLLGATPACGSEGTASEPDGASGAPGACGGKGCGSAGFANAGAENNADRPAVAFQFPVPGTADLVSGLVPEGSSAFIQIQGYPTVLRLPVLHSTLPVGYDSAFSESFCADVEATAKLGQRSDMIGSEARRLVREQAGPVTRFQLTSLIGPTFLTLARNSAQEAGAGSAAILENPLQITGVDVRLALSEDALTAILGESDSVLASLRSAVSAQALTAYEFGNLETTLRARDLWCDLAFERAVLFFEIEGRVGDESYRGTTELTSIAEL